jgi:hypothetical protein
LRLVIGECPRCGCNLVVADPAITVDYAVQRQKLMIGDPQAIDDTVMVSKCPSQFPWLVTVASLY